MNTQAEIQRDNELVYITAAIAGLRERAERAEDEAAMLRRLLTDAYQYVTDVGGPDCGLAADICAALHPNAEVQLRPSGRPLERIVSLRAMELMT